MADGVARIVEEVFPGDEGPLHAYGFKARGAPDRLALPLDLSQSHSRGARPHLLVNSQKSGGRAYRRGTALY